MKTILLAGGLGTRLSEETSNKPKPMVEIGGMPILLHIMNIYSAQGFSEFIVALGYKGETIKEYFYSYSRVNRDMTINMKSGHIDIYNESPKDFIIHLIDTGQDTMTGGRILRLKKQIGQERFMMTYGDGVGSIDLSALVAFHRSHGKLATVTAVRPPARFGGLALDGDRVAHFTEKPQIGEGWINGGFFILEPEVLDYIAGDDVSFERAPMEALAAEGQLMAYRHEGFWQCMDTLRDKQLLESLWSSGQAPWKLC